MRALVAMRISSRSPPMASPRISSASPPEYTSAVSTRFTPASRAIAICSRAPPTSIWPTGVAQPVPPQPIVPSVIVETRRPEEPSCRYCMIATFSSRQGR
jgi:hypothetical protein